MPTWVPVGRSGRAEAAARCAVASYTGTKPWLAQWTDGVRDYNLTCPGVTGLAARGNLLTRHLNHSTYTPSVRGFMDALFADTAP